MALLGVRWPKLLSAVLDLRQLQQLSPISRLCLRHQQFPSTIKSCRHRRRRWGSPGTANACVGCRRRSAARQAAASSMRHPQCHRPRSCRLSATPGRPCAAQGCCACAGRSLPPHSWPHGVVGDILRARSDCTLTGQHNFGIKEARFPLRHLDMWTTNEQASLLLNHRRRTPPTLSPMARRKGPRGRAPPGRHLHRSLG